jgi:hypothetical protein
MMLGLSLPSQICHPERSAAMVCPDIGDWPREVEGPRKYVNLRSRLKAFSRELSVARFSINVSSGCFDSRSLTFALAQHDKYEELEQT